MRKIANILLINDNTAHANWGAQASPPSLVKVLLEGLPGSSITTLSHAWLANSFYRRMHSLFGGRLITEEHGRSINSILHRCSSQVSFYPQVVDDFDYWADEWMAGRGGPQAINFLNLARKADIVIYNGENSIYRNTQEGCHGIFLLWLTKTRLGKTSCIVNHTAQLTGVLPIMSSMVKHVFPFLDLVSVREPCSLANLQAMGITNAELYPDVVFALSPDTYSRERADHWRRQNGLLNQGYFCLSASGLPVSMPQRQWDGEIASLVRELKTLGLQAVLMAKDPWCLPLVEVARRTDSIFFGPEHEYHDLWPLFEGASFLVSGHYHYVIFGSMVGCPFIPMTANNHKMQGVCEHLNWERTTPFDVTSLRSCRNDIVKEARRLRDNRPQISDELSRRSKEMHSEALRLGKRIAFATRASGGLGDQSSDASS